MSASPRGMLPSSRIFVSIFIIIEISTFFAWQIFLQREEHKYQRNFQARGNNRTYFLVERTSNEMHLRLRSSKRQSNGIFKNLHCEELYLKIKNAAGRNLQVRMVAKKASKNATIVLQYSPLSFPKNIDASKNMAGTSPTAQTKKYVFVQAQYADQLSKNTRALLSLCAQARIGDRKVVRPFVKQTRFSSNSNWSLLDIYYDTKYLESLLKAAGFASFVDEKEYITECPSNSPNHVSVHFIDNSLASKDYTKKHFFLNDDCYSGMLENTTRKGWSKCSFLSNKMGRKSGAYYCVNGDVIKSWETLEKDVIKDKKCLNIYLWRGIDGVTYRHKFSEERFEFSSVDVTYSLKPGKVVRNEVKRFTRDYLSANYIALYIRGEIMLRGNSVEYLRNCVDLALEVLVALKNIRNVSQVFVATDMSEFGSNWLAKQNGGKNPFKNIHARIISKSHGVSYKPSSDVVDRGVVALVDLSLISQAQHLISAGSGTFQKWVAAKFLEYHRSDEELWSKITVCT